MKVAVAVRLRTYCDDAVSAFAVVQPLLWFMSDKYSHEQITTIQYIIFRNPNSKRSIL